MRTLTPAECLVPGYYADPDWTVRDAVAHVGTWLAQAEVHLEQIGAGTHQGHDLDIDAINAEMLAAMHDRTLMLQDWYALPERTAEAMWWVRGSQVPITTASICRACAIGWRSWWPNDVDRRRPLTFSRGIGC